MENKYELTFPQKNILLVDEVYKDSKVNLITGIININKGFNTKFCNEAINNIIKNNDAMRINIIHNLNTYQQIREYKYESVDEVDMSKFTKEDVEKYINNFKNQNINITSKRLYEFKILKYSKDKGAILLKMHHIISDAWSYSKIIEQFVKYYTSLEKNEPIANENIPSYIDYITSTLEYKNSEKFKKDEKFWTEYLDSFDKKVSIKDTNKKINNISSRYNVKLDKDINDKLLNFCKENKISPYVMFITALSIYIYRIKDKNDFIIGTPSLNRSNFKEKQMLGMFVSTLPLRINITENITFLDLAHQISRNTMNIFRYQKYPYVDILKKIRNINNNTENLYSITLSYQNAKVEFEEKDKYDTKWYENNYQTDDLQIHILDMDNTGILEINYDYLNGLFEDIEIKYLHTRIMAIINNAIFDKNTNIENIDIMSKKEEEKILNEFNDTKKDYSNIESVIKLFEKQVDKTPNNVALVFENKKITYKKLNEMANSLANYFITKGIKPNDKIAILMRRTDKLIVSLLAILKCKATYIPIDITYPEERINYILNDCLPKFVLCEKMLNYENTIILRRKKFLQIVNKYSKDNIVNINNEDKNAYIIYTSGSTGNPKGVVISNKNLQNFVLGINEKICINTSSRVVSITTISFDIFGLDIWVSLTNGATLVLANEIQCLNGNELNLLCINNKVNTIQTTPTKLKLLLEQNNNFFITQMEKIILGGENISSKFIQDLKKQTKADIFDAYGPTETTIWSTINKLDDSKVSAGRPIANNFIYILDKKNRLMPINIPGQLAISGDSLSSGYYNNIENTNKSFVYNKFLDKKTYLTGDFCNIDFNGNLHILERLDLQVKINGQRVELQEIEKCINEYDNINNNIVSVKNNKLICFYSTKNKDKKIDNNELITFLYNKLPLYMIPKEYYYLEEFPMTLNGKIDRKKINCLNIKLENKTEHVKPMTKLQQEIYNVFKKVIKDRKFGVNDPFFELGIDSLDAIKVQVELLSIGIHVEYKDLFKYPTIIDLEKTILDKNLKNKDKLFVDSKNNNYNYEDILSTNSNYDYTPSKIRVGNVLLTGTTGFLGAHILDEYMKNTQGKIYCIVRSKDNTNYISRLKKRLNFYFGNKYDEQIGKRIIPIDTDITNMEEFNKKMSNVIKDVEFAIHSAACVKHYGDVEYFKTINVVGTENIANICFENNVKLIHISTISVSGNAFETANYNKSNEYKEKINFDETCFFQNQNLDNVYVYTKFKSEQIVLDYMKKGLQANIMRIGNLTNRYTDLKFQFNEKENAFFNRIKTLLNLKAFPKNNIDIYLEFTPVDYAAKAIIKLIEYFNIYHNVFHIYNNNHIGIYDFIKILNKIGIEIKILSDNDFSNKIKKILNSDKKDILNGIVNDLDKNYNLEYNTNVQIKGDYTLEYLKKIGFKWPVITEKYIQSYIEYINKF